MQDVVSRPRTLSVVDWVIIGIYLAIIFGIAVFFWWRTKRRKENSENFFFTGGGRNPVVVVGLSMWATITSSLFFINAPGQVAGGDWALAGTNIALISITPFIALWVIPFYRRLKESTAYAYLEKRFSYPIRALNSFSFIFFQVFRTAVVLYVPVTALSILVNFDSYILLAIVSVVVILTTVLGGFKAVIWSDAIQGTILLVGILSVLIAALANTNWTHSNAQLQNILTKDSWKLRVAGVGIQGLFLFNIVNSMYAFMGSQDVTQRYKGTKSISQIRRSLYITSLMGVIAVLLFFGAGSALYTYYTSHGWTPADRFTGIETDVNQAGFMVYFVQNVLPVGFIGLIFASVFAASQSTVSSGLSALSNSIVEDFVKRYNPKISAKALIWLSKSLVLFFGLLAMALGMLLIFTKQDDLILYFIGIVGLLNAPTVGVFVLGLYTTKANARGAMWGMIAAFAITLPIWIMSQKFIPEASRISFAGVWVALVSLTTTLVVGWIVSILTPKFQNPSVLVNRTMWTRTVNFRRITDLESKLGRIEKWAKKGVIAQSYLERANAKIEELELALERE